MLVISNGAFKCGSTWLYNILTNLRDFAVPGAEFVTGGNTKHPSIAEPKLAAYLGTDAFEKRDVISKNHLDKPAHRALLLKQRSVRVVCMTRDSRDVIVSAYYHDQRKKRFDGSFAQYYWQEGRMLLPRLTQYRRTWSEPHTQMVSTTFEALKTDFRGEVMRIAALIDVPVNEGVIDRIRKETDIVSLREKYKDTPSHRSEDGDFFRKGDIGDWRNHFDETLLADHDRVCRQGIMPFDRHYLLAKAKRKIRRVFA